MSWQQELEALGQINANVPLAPRTTLGVGGPAAWLFRPQNELAVAGALKVVPQDVLLFPLGRGSNLLINDDGIDGLVIDLSDVNTLEVNGTRIKAGSGVRMGKLAQAAATAGLTGLEFMATVPGDLGGGVAMNAGAFGQQVSDVLKSITISHRNGEVQELSREELNMQYRYTALPKGSLVLSATFELSESDSEVVRERMREIRKKRSDTQPLALPNCGSVFKNPEGDFAARLIESVGLKGHASGNARISQVHANFIVNEGGATAEDVLNLIRLARHEVLQQTGVELEPEVRLVGCKL